MGEVRRRTGIISKNYDNDKNNKTMNNHHNKRSELGRGKQRASTSLDGPLKSGTGQFLTNQRYKNHVSRKLTAMAPRGWWLSISELGQENCHKFEAIPSSIVLGQLGLQSEPYSLKGNNNKQKMIQITKYIQLDY